MSAVVALSNNTLPATATEIKAHVQRIQQVMKAVMKDKTHFGTIPGTPKPSLWKPGAEVLCATFHIAASYRVEDLSDMDCIRYRVTCIGTHQGTGVVLGEGMGECSSNEEKYKWRKAYNREYDAADDSRRRLKFGYDREKRQEYETKQVRTEPADLANTILKMGCKRAQVAMTLNVTAASDCFTQDLEDMPEELRGGGHPDDEAPRQTKPGTEAPKSNGKSGVATEKQITMIRKKAEEAGVSADEICQRYSIEAVSGLMFDNVNDCLQWIRERKKTAEPEPGAEG